MWRLLLPVLLLLVVIPAVEIATFIRVGDIIGIAPTVALTIFTAALGIFLVRLQGLSTLARLQQAMFAGGDPFREMLSGALLLLAGILLLIPGFVTDVIGFLLLVPPLRHGLARLLAPRLAVPAPASQQPGVTVIEAEVVHVRKEPADDDDPVPPLPPRGR